MAEVDRAVVDRTTRGFVKLVCDKRGRSLLELAFSWLAARPTVASVIAGATRPEQVEANLRAVGWALTAEEFAEVDRLAA